MRRHTEIRTRTRNRRSMAEKIAERLIHAGQRRPLVQRLLKGFVRFSIVDIRYDVSGKVFVLIGVTFVISALLGIDGWTTGKELRIFLSGMSLIALEMWLTHKRRRTLLDLYGTWHGGRSEWRNMVFDIRESYLDGMHLTLENELPGIAMFGRYEDRSGDSKETEPIKHGKRKQWENRPKKYLRAICWVWSDGEEEVRLEYRRAPVNVYASRFFQTKGLDGSQHDYLRNLIDREEWSCEPRFGWICRLGFFKIAVVASIVVTTILWGGSETIEIIWKMDVTANGIMTYARWSFLEASLVAFVAFVAVFARGHYFPAGVFRVDEEKETQRERDRVQHRAIKCLVGALAATFVAIGAPHLIATCATMDGTSSMMANYLRQTNMCWFVRSHTSLTERPQIPTGKAG